MSWFRRTRPALLAGLVALTVASATPASATSPTGGQGERPPSAEEQARFAEGLRLLQAGDARGAERAFKAGYAVAHDPAFLVRVGEAEERAGAPREAAESYARYLRESPDASDRQDIERRIERLAPPAPLAPQASTGDPETPGALPGAPSTAATPSSTAASPGAPPASAPPASPAASQISRSPHQVSDAEELRALVDENAPTRTRLNVAAWVSGGVTVLLLGTAAFYGAKAGERNGDVNRLLGNFNEKTGVPAEYATVARQYEDAVNEGRHDDRLAKGFAVAAGVAAVASIVLFVVDATRAPEATSEPARPVGLGPRLRSAAAGDAGLGLLTWVF